MAESLECSWGALKTGFLARRNFKQRKRWTMVANSSEPFVVQYNLRWIVVFPIFFQELKPVQEEASLHFIKRKDVFAVLPAGCGNSLIFQIVPRVCAYLHDREFNYPKAAVLVVVCLLTALIDAHIMRQSIPPAPSLPPLG